MTPRPTRRDEIVEASLAVGLAVAGIALLSAVLAVASGLAAEEAGRAWRHTRPTPGRGSIPGERHWQTRSAAAR